MRTTIDIDPDNARAIAELRRDHGQGLSVAVNHLIRRGLMAPEPQQRFVPRTHDIGVSIDVSNIAEALDVLEGSDRR